MRLIRNAHWILRDFSSAWRIRARRLVRREDALAFVDGSRQPVVVIPGVYENWEFMLPIARRLNAAGYPVHVITALGRNIAPITDAASVVARYLDEHDLRSVVLVTHSKGGLIGKQVMLRDDPHGRVERMVAVAAPFRGSSYARYMPVKPLRAFSPLAETVTALAADASVNTRIVSIYPAFDGHLPEGSELDGAVNVEVPVRGHFRVLVEQSALDAIESAVRGVG